MAYKHIMTAKKQRLLWACAEHYLRLIAADSWEAIQEEGIGSQNCALCMEYCQPVSIRSFCAARCSGCPIYHTTGWKHCQSSPYEEVARWWDTLKYILSSPYYTDDYMMEAIERFREAATQEYAMLVELALTPKNMQYGITREWEKSE